MTKGSGQAVKKGRYLVINGDDFGANHAHNLGVAKAFTEGIMTTAGIIAPSAWFSEAAALAMKHDIPVGVHLSLSCEYEGYQFGPLRRAPELSLDGKGYVFKRHPNQLDPKDIDIIIAELRAQVERMLDAGLRVTHLEEHMGCLPRWDGAFAGVIDVLCEEFQLPFNSPSPKAREVCRTDRILPVTRYLDFGDAVSFDEKKARIWQLLDGMDGGLHWICSHTADDLEELEAAWGDGGAQLRESRHAEMRVWCDPEVGARVRERGIQLIDAAEAAGLAGG